MSQDSSGKSPEIASIANVLDARVELACLGVYKALLYPTGTARLPIFDEIGTIQGDYLPRYNGSLQGLVFVADARAKLEDPSDSVEDSREWVLVARNAFYRLGRTGENKSVSDFRNNRLLTNTGADIQRKLYEEMVASRKKVDELLLEPRSRYAAHVALGEIFISHKY